MGEHIEPYIAAGRALISGLFMICAVTGCWEEIQYTGPDPSKVARRATRSTDVSADSTVANSRSQDPNEPAEELPKREVADAATAVEVEPQAEESNTIPGIVPAEEKVVIDDLEPEQSPPTAAPQEPPAALPFDEPVAVPKVSTRLAAWELGSKLTLAALANDRSLVPEDVAGWIAEARDAAETLGTSIDELPAPAAKTGDKGSSAVHDYLFQQGQRVWRDLTEAHGPDHAALFEVAVRSNVLLVLYAPGSSAADSLANSIREAGPRANLPPDLWQPLLDILASHPPAAKVRSAVRQMHAAVEQHLSREELQE
jgi:hypothetical protein